MEDLTKVFASNDPVKAKLIQGLMERNGIESRILDRKDSAYVMLGEVAVFVGEKDVSKARDLIENTNFEDGDDD
jgi:hypothetical protein